jgi:hypothetical protein
MKKLFFNPFEKYSEKKLLITGILATLIGIFLYYIFNIKTIGFLKFDFLEKISIFQVVSQSLIIISVLTIILFVTGKIINSKTRFIDVLNTVLVAKIPFFIIPFFNINGVMYRETELLKTFLSNGKLAEISMTKMPIIMIVSLLSVLLSVWVIALVYNGFKIATNAKGAKHIVYFIIAIIITEIVSRFIISTLH